MGESVKAAAKTPAKNPENRASQKKTEVSQVADSPAEQVLFLQRTIGNRAVERLIRSGGLQAKLRIGQPWDKYEQEADRVAEQVMRMPEPNVQLKRSCPFAKGSCTEKEKILQTKEVSGKTTQSSPALESQIKSLRGGGQPLPESVSAFFEPRFGHDFSRVRVHSGAAAEQSARDANAQAYTVGHNIVFGAGRFAPETNDGRRLIAHELTHVVQQSGGFHVGKKNETGGLPSLKPANHTLQQTAGQTQGECLQKLSWAEIKEKAYEGMIAGIRSARDGMRNGLKSLAAAHLPASLFPIADGIIEVAVTDVEILISIIMAVLGIVVGFGEGIIGMIEGLFRLVFGVITLLYDLISGIFTNFDAAKKDLNAIWEALIGLPNALKKLVTDWLDKFGKASSERQSLMIGELTGQVLALIATFAVAAGRAGSAAKAAATTEETAAVAGATNTVAVAARARPALTVIEGGGGRGVSTAARAASGPGAGDIVGSNALKVAPVVEPIPPPLRLVPPLPAEAPAVANAAAVTSRGTKVGLVAGIGVTAVVASVPKSQPLRNPKQTCDNAVLDRLQAEKNRICNSIPGESCSPSKVSKKRLARRPCSEIRQRIQAMRDCLKIRQRIQDECFGGKPDPVHEDAMKQINNGLDACLSLEAVNCAPGHPMANL